MKRNTNFKNVKVRADRHCEFCNDLIPKGTEALTVSKKNEGRYWICMKEDCQYLEIFGMTYDEYAHDLAMREAYGIQD